MKRELNIQARLLGEYLLVAVIIAFSSITGIFVVNRIGQAATVIYEQKYPITETAGRMRLAHERELHLLHAILAGGEDERPKLLAAAAEFLTATSALQEQPLTMEERASVAELLREHEQFEEHSSASIAAHDAAQRGLESSIKALGEADLAAQGLVAKLPGETMSKGQITQVWDAMLALHRFMIRQAAPEDKARATQLIAMIAQWPEYAQVRPEHEQLAARMAAFFAAFEGHQRERQTREAALEQGDQTGEELSRRIQLFTDDATRHMSAAITSAEAMQSFSTILLIAVAVIAFAAAALASVYFAKRMSRQKLKDMDVLASATSEISASVTQLAENATETATAVLKTTATIEEVKQTSLLATHKAKAVSDSARQMVQVSQAGDKAAHLTREEIDRIRRQMELVAASIVKLGEQSQMIGEIITSVDDLAEQSNLLAVNAAIEAAKAGEQGRGFAVVAQEIKSLAEQSKHATGRVRTILGDIQKATGAAVMATEQGSKAVDAGVKQARETGDAIRILADSVAEAAQAAAQIAASAQQQYAGVDQVTSAMETIRQGSGQNVESTRQLELSAANLRELSAKMKQLIGIGA